MRSAAVCYGFIMSVCGPDQMRVTLHSLPDSRLAARRLRQALRADALR
jgi:hypothetical protein